VLFATEGKDGSTVGRFAEDLAAHGGDPSSIQDVHRHDSAVELLEAAAYEQQTRTLFLRGTDRYFSKANEAIGHPVVTLRLSDDWHGADFIAQHIDGRTFIKVQLKSRPAFAKKYQRKDLFIAFFDGASWFLYPHDEVLEKLLSLSTIGDTMSWSDRGDSWKSAQRALRDLLEPFRLGDIEAPLN
jgi:hypothetical protein